MTASAIMGSASARLRRWAGRFVAAIGAAALATAPAIAQDVETFDPDEAYGTSVPASQGANEIDADLAQPGIVSPARVDGPSVAPPLEEPQSLPSDATGPVQADTTASSEFEDEFSTYSDDAPAEAGGEGDLAGSPVDGAQVASAEKANTYSEDDLIGAAEGVFGKGAEGLARMIEDLLREQGEPNGYIVGREAGGAFILGARYGSGTLFHKVEGEQKVYWTGPSIGLDAGANAAKTFVLVYNLFDTEELFARFPAGEGQAYLIGGLHASYMRKGDKVLIPIRMGAGVRLGVNAGYMKFSKKQRWLPF